MLNKRKQLFQFMPKILKLGLLSYISLCCVNSYAQLDFKAKYMEALTKSQKKNYPEALKDFYIVMVSSGDPDLKSKSEFATADTLRRMELYYSSAYFYAKIVAQGPKNNFFRQALEYLSDINTKYPLGRASVAGLFDDGKIDPLFVHPSAHGFYFFHKGLEAFDKQNTAMAKADFSRVPPNSPYYPKAQYYFGVMLTLSKELDYAISAFSRVVNNNKAPDNLQQLSLLGMARVYYEMKNYRKAFEYFSKIPRNSDLWLESLFEGAWAFFMIQKHNNTLGNLHTVNSPFFSYRFFPESNILSAITYLKLCRYDNVKSSLRKFKERYQGTYTDLGELLRKYQGKYAAFYGLVAQYHNSGNQRLSEFPRATEVIDSISRVDVFKETNRVIDGLDREKLQKLKRLESKLNQFGLYDLLKDSFDQRKQLTVARAGEDVYSHALNAYRYLKDLSVQTEFIEYDRVAGKTDEVRDKLMEDLAPSDGLVWGEGMKPLDIKQQLEYWPFEGEYWEDEQGAYVYNVGSLCGAHASDKK